MKKLIILLGVLTVSLTSCLKDKPNVDFSNIGAFTELVHSGAPYFNEAAITDAADTIVKTLQVNITGQYPPTKDVTVTIGVDNALLTAYNAANTAIVYEAPPAGSFKIGATSVTIKAGSRLANIPVTFYKKQLDPSKSYMLPIKIVSSTIALSGNFTVKYYHFIGNDFAGTYNHFYTRWEQADTTASAPSSKRVNKGTSVFNPISPTEFTVTTSYYTAPRYDVTFVKTGNGATATYSKFVIKFYGTDIADLFTPGGVVLATGPFFLPADYHTNPFDPNGVYTYAQSLKLFRFFFTTASRGIIDEYTK
ncbi:DUF1735 domain-containing protein [Mucilaginibacter ginsenosidivorax]|uniref:DUF1735 domain-containing protein n=1 Tax=Mucilaginibacter ginsenosidivorax TaxID=862126 RepID=A0A5B8VYY3_9SPHI|nr:DUF1735 domain-containing protein [Mucilaginibacter ginsenosidivorax]QEC76787.1 DUF1735 domain-containing protein [Mucilaginibacter ginsenosidivorax]